MKKKHRDIVVNGVQYGWIAMYGNVRIFKDKVIIGTYTIPDHLDITPKIVAALIKDPVAAMQWITAENCPFCGESVVPHPNPEWQKQYVVCYHDEDCWSNDDKPPFNFNLIPISALDKWNRRHN